MDRIGPLILHPRLDPKPWGGRRLAHFGFELPPGEQIGEAVITAPEAVVIGGPREGEPLGEIVATEPGFTIGPEGLRATAGRAVFPLLIKFIDAAADLSIQVHPDDGRAPGESLGKTEAWHVLEAATGSSLYLGLEPGVGIEHLEALSRSGQSTAGLLRRLPATPGMTFFLPAGTVHALGAGIVIYEIQQPSAVTYRLDDWGRVDPEGRARELHIDEALSVLEADARPEPVPRIAIPSLAGTREHLVQCAFFAVERIALGRHEALSLVARGSPQTITVLDGDGSLEAAGIRVDIAAGMTGITFAGDGPVAIRSEAPLVALRGWVPESALAPA